MTSDKAAVIQRYGFEQCHGVGSTPEFGGREDGRYVLYTDHAAALQSARDEVDRLRFQVAKASQVLRDSIDANTDGESILTLAVRASNSLYWRFEGFKEQQQRAEAAERRVAAAEALVAKWTAEVEHYDNTCDPNDPEDWMAGQRYMLADLVAALAPAKKVD